MAASRDPYTVLGVARGASADDIKHAYRQLAKQYHPDLNPGRSDIEQRFKEISAAYNLLSDADKRTRFDRGDIDADGQERAHRPHHRSHAGARTGAGAGTGDRDDAFAGFGDDIFSDLFGNRRRGGGGAGGSAGAGAAGGAGRGRGADIAYSVTVPFAEAMLGTKRRINLSTGKSIDVAIPPGTEDQQKLRLKGQGVAASGGGGHGDAIVEVHVEPHPYLTRQDNDLHLEVPVSLPEAILGASIKVPTLEGTVSLKVPKGSNTGTVLRLKGKGVPDGRSGARGDQYVKLKVVLPDPPDPDLTEFLERWSKDRSYDVRNKMGLE